MKFTKEELRKIHKICDAIKARDSLVSEIYSKMRSAYPDAISHKAISKNGEDFIAFGFNKKPDRKLLNILQSLGFTIKSKGGNEYEANKGKSKITIYFDVGRDYTMRLNIEERK